MVWHAVRGTSPKISFKNLCSNHSGGAVKNWTSVFLQEKETVGRSSCPVCCWSSNHIGALAQWACACPAMEWRPPREGAAVALEGVATEFNVQPWPLWIPSSVHEPENPRVSRLLSKVQCKLLCFQVQQICWTECLVFLVNFFKVSFVPEFPSFS